VEELFGTQSFWSKTFADLEASIVSGQHQQGRAILDSVSPKTLPRQWAYRYADLANRIHHSIYALKALHRFIAPENPHEPAATDQEKMIYGYALCILGATEEALSILNSIPSGSLPEATFLKAITNFRLWNYSQSIPLLKEYLSTPGLETYRCLVGEVNLVAAFVATEQWDQALAWLEKIQTSCQGGKYSLLLGNSFELKAQVLFFQQKYDEALAALDQARELLKDQQGLYLLFVEKWTLVCHLFQKSSPENLAALGALRSKASGLEDFETVRECELFEAIATQNEQLLRKVIMGTPSEHYRQRARQLFGKALRPLGQFEWKLNQPPSEKTVRNPKENYVGTSGKNQVGKPVQNPGANPVAKITGKPVIFDPYEKQNSQAALYEQPHLLALFEALTIDFYKPNHLGALFKAVYPTEKFNPYTSPARVMQLLKRLDRWLQSNQVPVRVEFKKSQFSLTATAPVYVIVQRGKKMSSFEGRWSEIKNSFDGRTFTSAKISEVVGISKTSAQRLIKQALQDGRVQTVGRGRGAAYQFATRKKSKQAA